jgi:restriction system protein
LDFNDWEMESFLEERFKAYITTSGAGTEDLREIDQMSGIQFEVWVADSLKAHGDQNVRGTPATGDQGADLITELDGKKIIIQTKRFKANAGNAAVQEVSSAVAFYKADEGCVITSSDFTESAVQLARICSVKPIDRNQLLEPERWGKLGQNIIEV